MFFLCVLIMIIATLLAINNTYQTKENFYGYPWHESIGWSPNWWSSWWNRPWFNRPYYPRYSRGRCPVGCRYSPGSTSGFRCLDPGANCPVGAQWCCQYDYDCNGC